MVFELLSRTSLVLVLIGLCLHSSYGDYDAAPHIVVFMADDLGWNDVGFHGSSQIPTPNIDALAYNGLILNRHYVLPSCSPTRAAFLTGKYPIRIGMQGESIKAGEPRGLPLNVRLLPEHLRDLGYSPRLIGKWHLGFHTRQHTPLHRGFDSFLGFYNSHVSYYDYRHSYGNMSGFDLHRGDMPAHDIQGEYLTDLFTEEAEKIIEHHDPMNPLYLQVSHQGVHAPLEVPPGHFNEQFYHIHSDHRRKYAKMVSSLDESLGRIVTALGYRGMLKNTIILFLTDNGAAVVGNYQNYGSNWPLRGSKYSLYEGAVRGVAAIWSPRLHGMANVSNNLMHVTDWLPTLYAAAGGNMDDLGDIDGVNHWPHLSKGKSSPRETLLLNINEVSKTEGAIHRRFKLVRGSYQLGFYDKAFIGEKGRTSEVPEYNYTLVHKSAVASSISAHLQGPMTQPSQMSHLREQASVICQFPRRDTFVTCNETDCLFDIVNDPCEFTNIAKHNPRMVTFLDRYLEKYGNVLVKQPRVPVDWLADPRRYNNTWEPWLSSNIGDGFYGFNGATALSTLAVCAHIGMVLIIVGIRAFI